MVISEAPIMAPLVPLAEYVAGVGPPPPREALHTYLARLREQVLAHNDGGVLWLQTDR